MSCIKKWALAEPLVDYVDRKSINSEACCILVIFYYFVNKNVLEFGFKNSPKRRFRLHIKL